MKNTCKYEQVREIWIDFVRFHTTLVISKGAKNANPSPNTNLNLILFSVLPNRQ